MLPEKKLSDKAEVVVEAEAKIFKAKKNLSLQNWYRKVGTSLSIYTVTVLRYSLGRGIHIFLLRA